MGRATFVGLLLCAGLYPILGRTTSPETPLVTNSF
jgi:hypothetical protein